MSVISHRSLTKSKNKVKKANFSLECLDIFATGLSKYLIPFFSPMCLLIREFPIYGKRQIQVEKFSIENRKRADKNSSKLFLWIKKYTKQYINLYVH